MSVGLVRSLALDHARAVEKARIAVQIPTDLASPREVAEVLNCRVETVRLWLRSGKFKVYRMGENIQRVSLSEVLTYALQPRKKKPRGWALGRKRGPMSPEHVEATRPWNGAPAGDKPTTGE